MLLEQYRSTEFSESISQGVFFNHAASSPMPARVRSAITAAMMSSARSPEQYFFEHVIPAMGSVRSQLGQLMGVPADDIAMMRNTSQGLSVIADGLSLEAGDNVLVAGCEYPSVVYPWYAQAWRGVETRVIPAEPDGSLSLDAFAAKIDGRTRAISISWVQYATGFRADLRAFVDLAHVNNCVIIVDAIQALGVLPLNGAELGIDFIVTGTQKWLIGPHGMGALYIRPELLDRMHLVNVGACSVVDIPKFDSYDFTVKPNAQRYEEGSPNGLGTIGLNAALEILLEAGIANIAEHVLAITRHAMSALDARGYRVASPLDDERRAGIVMFDHPDHASDSLLTQLRAARVTASVRSGRVRFSPHFYNTMEDVDTAIAALP